MTGRPLREQIAERIAKLHFGDNHAWEDMPEAEREGLREEADEVIRLMEWARKCEADAWRAVRPEMPAFGGITLPPPDWKVPE